MPSTREGGDKVTVAIYNVVAADGDVPRFIRHTGLASRAGRHDRQSVEVHDMGPPLHAAGPMPADAVGRLRLTENEARKIKDFVDRHELEHRAVSQLTRRNAPHIYCIFPHAVPLRSEDGKRHVRMRFSCAGFVLEAYQRAGVKLIDTDRVPLVALDEIKPAYPEFTQLLDRAEYRAALGLAGPGPWRVMLCGYLINSLSRDGASIRAQAYLVQPGDEKFPRD